MSKLTVRHTIESDLSALETLYSRAFGQLLSADYDADVLRVAVPLMGKAQRDLVLSGTYYVALGDRGRILGAGGWTRLNPETKTETGTIGHIRHFAVDPDARRTGLARAIMARVLADCRDAGMTDLSCLSTLTAVKFYEASGFRVQEHRDVHLGGGVMFPSVQMNMKIRP